MHLIEILLILCIPLVYWRKKHQQKTRLVFKYKLYAVRDELRKGALNGKVDKDSFGFRYFDQNLSLLINQSYYYTLFNVLFVAFSHPHSRAQNEMDQKLKEEIKASAILQSIQDRQLEAIRNYLVNQHFVTSTFIVKPILILIFGPSFLFSKINNYIQQTFQYPQNFGGQKRLSY